MLAERRWDHHPALLRQLVGALCRTYSFGQLFAHGSHCRQRFEDSLKIDLGLWQQLVVRA
jgi:hypothetical protein